jgi:hypothetical protein
MTRPSVSILARIEHRSRFLRHGNVGMDSKKYLYMALMANVVQTHVSLNDLCKRTSLG